jgi:FAD/FMN-containing dehydrogenase
MFWKTNASEKAARKVDVRGLEADLKAKVDGEIRFDRGTRALYATDGSNYRQVPIGVVIPRNRDAVIAAVGVCRDYAAPILSRGCGTSLCGQTCNVAVVIDHSKYRHHILEIDPDRKSATVEPGLILDDLRHRAVIEYGLIYGPDPATHSHCTFGGMLGNNSCGVHSVMAGRTADNVYEMDILTYDGVQMRVGPTSEEELNRIIVSGGPARPDLPDPQRNSR